MNRKRNVSSSFSSSSAFIIILILIVVSVAAIIVGGGDGFARKYAGVDFKDIGVSSILAQTGVVGKSLQFEEVGGNEFTLRIEPIKLDGEVLGVGEKYVANIVPPLEGDNPWTYRDYVGSGRGIQGYPVRRDFVEAYNLDGQEYDGDDPLPVGVIPGVVDCAVNPNSQTGFEVFFEDIAYETGVGFDHPELGQARQDAICETLQEFETMLNLDEDGLNPGIVVQASGDKTPDHSLSVVAPQYVGGSGFVSTLLADYLRTGVRRSATSFTEDVSVLGINSGFVRYNFDDYDWSVDTGSEEDYDLKTVTRQNMLRLLGFGSFIGHEQENVLSTAWKRWTEWDRLLVDQNIDPLVDGEYEYRTLNDYGYDTDNSGDFEANEYDFALREVDGVQITAEFAPDTQVVTLPQYSFGSLATLFTQENKFQKGQSLSGLADPEAVSHPVLQAGDEKFVTDAEKQILCLLGLSVDGFDGCEVPRTVVADTYIERENNRSVCVNLFDNTFNALTDDFALAEDPFVTGGILGVEFDSITLYDTECEDSVFLNPPEKDAWDAQHATDDYQEAVAIGWEPLQETAGSSEYLTFTYSVVDGVSGRQSDPGTIAIHKCVVTSETNQLCNGDFEYNNALSPVDFQLPSLEDRDFVIDLDQTVETVKGCSSTTMPGWCGQGAPDVFSSEFGYTWHPFFIKHHDELGGDWDPKANPPAIQDLDKNGEWDGVDHYAGGVAGEILIQRLRAPLEPTKNYTISGRVFITEENQNPQIWLASSDAIMQQNDGTYHINYPDPFFYGDITTMEQMSLLAGLPAPEAGVWYEFQLPPYSPVSGSITHVGFGGVDNAGRILFDDLSIAPTEICSECDSDINGDCALNTADTLMFLTRFTELCPGNTTGCVGDLSPDGIVNASDLLLFLGGFSGVSCEEPDDTELEDDSGSLIPINNLNELPEDIANRGVAGLGIVPRSDDDEDLGFDSVRINAQLNESLQIVPNSQGFQANYRVEVQNVKNRDIDNLRLVDVVPSYFEYVSHVSTAPDIAYTKSQDTIFVPELREGEDLDIYLEVQLSSSLCSSVERTNRSGYESLITMGLCPSFQELLENRYGILRDEFGNIINTGGSNNTPQEDDEIGVQDPECSDGIDNDKDGWFDLDDADCDNETDDTESGSTDAATTPECNDGIDNDGDRLIDLNDPDCDDKFDDREAT